MFSFGKTNFYLGVDFGAGGVKMVELKKEKNRPVLFTYGLTTHIEDIHHLLEIKDLTLAEQLSAAATVAANTKKKEQAVLNETRIDNYANLIRSVCKESRITAKVAVASVPVSAVFHAIVTLPAVKKQDFERILRAEVKKLLPYPLEETALDYQVIPGGSVEKGQRVLVNAVPRTLVAFYTKIFNQAGLKLDSLEPESMALSRALVGRDTATVLLIDIGAERTNFFIIDQTVPITHHSIEIGGEKINHLLQNILGVETGLVEQIKTDLFTHLMENGQAALLPKDAFLRDFISIIDPIAKEIDYSLELYMRQTSNLNKAPERIILTGGGSLFPYLADYIGSKFNLKCYVGDPWGRVIYQEGLKPVLRSIAPRMSVAIGLALRNMV